MLGRAFALRASAMVYVTASHTIYTHILVERRHTSLLLGLSYGLSRNQGPEHRPRMVGLIRALAIRTPTNKRTEIYRHGHVHTHIRTLVRHSYTHKAIIKRLAQVMTYLPTSRGLKLILGRRGWTQGFGTQGFQNPLLVECS